MPFRYKCLKRKQVIGTFRGIFKDTLEGKKQQLYFEYVFTVV